MSALSVSLRSDIHAAPPSYPSTDLEAQHAQEAAKVFDQLDAGEVMGEVVEAEPMFLAALRRRDEALVGRIVLNVCKAYSQRIADRVVFGAEFKNTPSAAQAAGMAMLGRTL